MKTRIVLILFALILASTLAMATPAITINYPTTNSIVYGGQTTGIDFNIVDTDSNGILATIPAQINLYYSTIAGSKSYLILTDTNITNGTGGIVCADYNFDDSTNCDYNWATPGTGTLPSGYYYLDINYAYQGESNGVLADEDFSSNRFEAKHTMSTSIIGMITLALFIAACAIAVFAVMGLSNGADIRQFAVMVIIALVLIVIAWTLYATAIVV